MLYLVLHDSQSYYIQAESFADAVSIWSKWVAQLWSEDDHDESPESVQLIHREPVITSTDIAARSGE